MTENIILQKNGAQRGAQELKLFALKRKEAKIWRPILNLFNLEGEIRPNLK